MMFQALRGSTVNEKKFGTMALHYFKVQEMDCKALTLEKQEQD
jgi:hypothetical protein